MTDWDTEPRTSLNWQDFVDAIKQRDVSVAKMDYEFDSNIPDGVIRWNASASRFEIKNGASWDSLAAQFDMNVSQLEGNEASDFTPSDHVGSRGSQHANATQAESGFISSTDKFKLDSATSSPTNNAIVQRDSSGRAQVSSPSNSNDIARKVDVDNAESSANSYTDTNAVLLSMLTSLVDETTPNDGEIPHEQALVEYAQKYGLGGVGSAIPNMRESTDDYNDAAGNAIYDVNPGSNLNSPVGGNRGILVSRSRVEGDTWQTLGEADNEQVWARFEANETWKNWKRYYFHGESIDYIDFINHEASHYSEDGRLFWDLSDGIYIVSSNAFHGNPALAWTSANFTAGPGLSVSYTASDRPTLGFDYDTVNFGSNSDADLTQNITNLNNITQAGIHTCGAGNANSPTSNHGAVMVIRSFSNNKITQIWFNQPNASDNGVYIRNRGNDGTWTSWDQIN